MDILAHGLWAAAAAKAADHRQEKKGKPALSLKPLLAAWWGIFPDLLAFTPFFVWFFWQFLFGDPAGIQMPRFALMEPTSPDTIFIQRLTHFLYSFSHSLLVFLAVAFAIWLWRRMRKGVGRLPWEMGGWLLHVLIDIPTHTYTFFPTPFLWPVSEFKLGGVAWGEPWFMVLNYGLLLAAFVFLRLKRRKPVPVSVPNETPSLHR